MNNNKFKVLKYWEYLVAVIDQQLFLANNEF